MTAKTVLALNGPGLAELAGGPGRERCVALCEQLGLDLDFRQTDDPEELAQWVSNNLGGCSALVINPGDDKSRSELRLPGSLDIPVIEVRLTNDFRGSAQPTKPVQGPEGKTGIVCGLGLHGYLLAIRAIADQLRAQDA